MINYIGIDYYGKYKVLLPERRVMYYDESLCIWRDIKNINISSSYVSVSKSNVFTFNNENGIIFNIELFNNGTIMTIIATDSKTYERAVVEEQYFATHGTSPDLLFAEDNDGSISLVKNTFNYLTDSDVKRLTVARKEYLINYIRTNISNNLPNEIVVDNFVRLLPQLVHRTNPSLEEYFEKLSSRNK